MIDFAKMDHTLCLAPMAGITDCTFRQLCMEYGCDHGTTEMISANGLIMSPKENHIQRQLMERLPEEVVGVQLFGCNTQMMFEAAKMVGDLYDFVDINMGCPSQKIVQGGSGAALGRDRGLARIVIEAVKDAVNVPVTVKMRLGWDDDNKNYLDLAIAAEEEGVAAIAIHGRTKVQMYSGKADTEAIAKAVKAVSVPVIANGDIFTPEDAVRMFEVTGCKAVMVGRGAMGNPFIFRQIKQLMATGKYDEIDPEEKLQTALKHTSLMLKLKGERVATYEMRKHVGWYIKGMRSATDLREKINKAENTDAICQLLTDYIRSSV